MNLDFYVFNLINQFAGRWIFLDKIAIFFAEYFQYILIIVLATFLFVNFRKYLPMLMLGGVSIFLSRVVLTETIRYFIPRSRPFIENQVNLILEHSASSSFPSGHAALFFALAMAVCFYNKKAGILFFISAVLISVSRLFAGLHWPSDVIAGAMIGIISAWLISLSVRRFFSAEAKGLLSRL